MCSHPIIIWFLSKTLKLSCILHKLKVAFNERQPSECSYYVRCHSTSFLLSILPNAYRFVWQVMTFKLSFYSQKYWHCAFLLLFCFKGFCFGKFCFPADANLLVYSLGHHSDHSFGKVADAGIGRVEGWGASVTWVVTAHAHTVLALVSDAGEFYRYSSSLYIPLLCSLLLYISHPKTNYLLNAGAHNMVCMRQDSENKQTISNQFQADNFIG